MTRQAVKRPSRVWIRREATIGVGVAAIVLAATFHESGPPSRIGLCGFRLLTSLPCPGCGMCHSLTAFGHGRFLESLTWHPLGPAVFCGAVVLAVRSLLRIACARSHLLAMPRRATAFLSAVGLIILAVLWITRIAECL